MYTFSVLIYRSNNLLLQYQNKRKGYNKENISFEKSSNNTHE